MMELDIVRPTSSNWSPLHIVPMKTPGDYHLCGDFRALNNATIPDRYPIPHIQDFATTLHGPTIVFEAGFGSYTPSDSRGTVRCTQNGNHNPFGLFEILWMPFGLRNAAETVQRFVDRVLLGLNFVCTYIDAVLIASCDAEEHN